MEFYKLRNIIQKNAKKENLFFHVGSIDWQIYAPSSTPILTAVLTINEQPIAKIVLVSESELDIFFPQKDWPCSIGYKNYRFSNLDAVESLFSRKTNLPYPQADNLGRHLIEGFKKGEDNA